MGRDIDTTSRRSLFSEAELALGLILSLCLGGIAGFIMHHRLGRLIFSSAVGAMVLVLYLVSYSFSAIWRAG